MQALLQSIRLSKFFQIRIRGQRMIHETVSVSLLAVLVCASLHVDEIIIILQIHLFSHPQTLSGHQSPLTDLLLAFDTSLLCYISLQVLVSSYKVVFVRYDEKFESAYRAGEFDLVS